jgi:dolichyl-phosphate beta-glucosyltransferase
LISNFNDKKESLAKILFVVPCFNEGARLDVDYFERLVKLPSTFWIFINDGSKDNTVHLLEELCVRNNTKLISNQRNLGKSKSLQLGFNDGINSQEEFEWIGFIDSDCAIIYEDVVKVLRLARNTNYDSIFSSRVKLAGRVINRKRFRHFFGRLIAGFLSSAWPSMPYDTQCGFKLFKNNNSLQIAMREKFQTRWFFDIEVVLNLTKISGSKIKIWEEPLTIWGDVEGSKIGWSQAGKILIELTYIYYCLFRVQKFLT